MAISLADKEYITNAIKCHLHPLRNASIFISGATGFFGKWLLESFVYLNTRLKLNAHVYALSRNPENFLKQFTTIYDEKCISWIKGDIKTFEFPDVVLQYIIHAATESDSKLNTESPLEMIDTIDIGTRRVLEFARKQSTLKAMLFTSSGAVYGKQPGNVTGMKETDSFKIDLNSPGSAYAEGKRLAELYCSIYEKIYKVPVKIARCFAFVGPYLPLDKHYAIGNFIYDGLNGRNITISGDGLPLRSYMYSADLVIWLWTLLLEGECGEAYNVGSDKPTSIHDLAFKIAEFFPGISVNTLNLTRPGDRNQNYIPDVSKFKNKFKFDQNTDLDNAIQKTISFYKNINEE